MDELSQQELNGINYSTYDATAREYHDATKDIAMGRYAERFLEEITNQKKPLLDLGCGSGRDAKYFQDKGYSVIGVDISDKMIEIAQTVSPESKFYVADIAKLPLGDNYFSGIWANSSLLHVSRHLVGAVLQDCYDFLTPNSPFFISVKAGIGEEVKPDSRFNNLPKAWTYYEPGELENLLDRIGFEVLETDSDVLNAEYAQGQSRINILAKKY